MGDAAATRAAAPNDDARWSIGGRLGALRKKALSSGLDTAAGVEVTWNLPSNAVFAICYVNLHRRVAPDSVGQILPC